MRRLQQTRLVVIALIAISWAGTSSSWGQADPAHEATIWFGTTVEISPDPDAADLWVCGARLEDLGSGELLSAPTIVIAAGEQASVQSGLPSGAVWELRVEVTTDGGTATWFSQVTLGDQVLSIGKGSVELARG